MGEILFSCMKKVEKKYMKKNMDDCVDLALKQVKLEMIRSVSVDHTLAILRAA